MERRTSWPRSATSGLAGCCGKIGARLAAIRSSSGRKLDRRTLFYLLEHRDRYGVGAPTCSYKRGSLAAHASARQPVGPRLKGRLRGLEPGDIGQAGSATRYTCAAQRAERIQVTPSAARSRY
jgi:hypothetical protein